MMVMVEARKESRSDTADETWRMSAMRKNLDFSLDKVSKPLIFRLNADNLSVSGTLDTN